MKAPLRSSLTRLTSFEDGGFDIAPIPRPEWSHGDYVVATVPRRPAKGLGFELANGRQIHLSRDDLVMGALGVRHATLESTGSWENVGDDGKMHLLTGAGLCGKLISQSAYCARPIEVAYVGHVMRGGRAAGMIDFVSRTSAASAWNIPTIVIVGSSMSAGKTSAARSIIRRLGFMGLKVIGGKLTGAGRYRDILSMGDAGADWIFDFVDAGFPSTVCPPEDYRRRIRDLLGRMAETQADVAVIEAGASPLEPYNGDVAVALLGDTIRILVLCASDPYAVIGIQQAFGRTPDVVGGAAANTVAGRELVTRLTGLPTLDFTAEASRGALDALLIDKLGLDKD